MAQLNVETQRRAMRRFEFQSQARNVILHLMAMLLMLTATPMLGYAAYLMPKGRNNTEPQLIAAQVMFFVVPAAILWATGMLILSKARPEASSRRLIFALAVFPPIVLVGTALPTLVNVCNRAGGVCG